MANSFQNVGDNSAIPDQVITSLTQDKQGFLWIGTPNGLVRYDGYRFQLHSRQDTNASSLAGNFVQDLLVRHNDELWITTSPGGITIYQPEARAFHRLEAPFVEENPVFWQNTQSLAESASNTLWVGSRYGLAQIDSNGQATILQHPKLDNSNVRTLLASADMLWIGTQQGLLQLHMETGVTSLRSWPQLASYRIHSIYQSSDGHIWVGTNNGGLFRWQPDSDSMQPVPLHQDPVAESQTIYDIIQLNDELWLARFTGLERVSITELTLAGRFEHDPSDPFSLPHSDIRVLVKDQLGSLWLGSYGGGLIRYQGHTGISMLRHSLKFTNGLSNPNISSILERQNGDIWLGTRGAGIDVFQPGKGIIQRYPPTSAPAQLQQGWISAMAEMADGTLWLGASPGQLYTFDDEQQQFQLIDEAAGYSGNNVRRLMADSQQNLWLATNQGVKVWYQNQSQFTPYPLWADVEIRDSINAIVEDQRQQIWIGGGGNGLFRGSIHSNGAKQVQFANQTAPLSILGMLIDQQGQLWLDTASGLFVIPDVMAETPELFPPTDSKHPNTGTFGANLLQDKRGRIWTQNQLYDPTSQLVYRLTSADGVNLGTPWFRSYTQTRNGIMLFGGSQGLLIVDPEQFEPWLLFPPIVITSLQVDGETVVNKPYDKVRLTASQQRLTVEFAALDLSAPQHLSYSYQLAGFDKQWQYLDAGQRQVSYTNLWPGEYTLKVRSTNRNGDWGPVHLELPIYIEPKIWQRGWFLFSLLLLVFLLIYALVQFRTRVSRQRAHLLEQQVNERNQELKQAQKLLIEKEKMASLGQVVAGVAHELNTPLGIGLTSSTMLLDEAEQMTLLFQQKQITNQKMQSFLQHCREHLQLLIKNLERSADLVHHFKQVAVDQNDARLQSIQLPHWLQERVKPYQLGYPDIDFQLSCPASNLKVRAQALEQIIFQLLQNCCLHAFAMNGAKQVRIQLSLTDTTGQLLIEDDGQGIPPDIQQRIFEPFVTSKRGSQCHGLGLHLSYNLASQVLNGNIELQHSSPKGTRFLVRFPHQPESV